MTRIYYFSNSDMKDKWEDLIEEYRLDKFKDQRVNQ